MPLKAKLHLSLEALAIGRILSQVCKQVESVSWLIKLRINPWGVEQALVLNLAFS